MTLKRVVFPAPFGPIRPAIVPSSNSSETSSRATMPPNLRVTFSTVRRATGRRSYGAVLELDAGIRRVTFALPLGIDHVHCYLLAASGGGWIVVDTGLGLPDAGERWARVLDELGEPVERIVITHFHPDHVGAAADLAAMTSAPVHQGADDYFQCVRTWGELRNDERMPDYLRVHGVPASEVESFRAEAAAFVHLVRFARDPELVAAGGRVDGWGGVHLPGHAEGPPPPPRGGI